MHATLLKLRCHWEWKVSPPSHWMSRQIPCLPCTIATVYAHLAHEVPTVHHSRGSWYALLAFLLSACFLTTGLKYKRHQWNSSLEVTFLASNLYLAIMHLKVDVVICSAENVCYCWVTNSWSLLEQASLSAISQTTRCDFMFPLYCSYNVPRHSLCPIFFLMAATLKSKCLELSQMSSKEFLMPGVRHVNSSQWEKSVPKDIVGKDPSLTSSHGSEKDIPVSRWRHQIELECTDVES